MDDFFTVAEDDAREAQNRPPSRAMPLAAAAWPLLPRLCITRLANSLTSSCVIRPPGPVPAT